MAEARARKTEILIKFDGDVDKDRDIPALLLLSEDGGERVRPVVFDAEHQNGALVLTLRWDGVPIGLHGDRPDLDMLLQAFNARRKV